MEARGAALQRLLLLAALASAAVAAVAANSGSSGGSPAEPVTLQARASATSIVSSVWNHVVPLKCPWLTSPPLSAAGAAAGGWHRGAGGGVSGPPQGLGSALHLPQRPSGGALPGAHGAWVGAWERGWPARRPAAAALCFADMLSKCLLHLLLASAAVSLPLPPLQGFTVYTGGSMVEVRGAYARGDRAWCGLPHLLSDSPNCTVGVRPYGSTFVAVAKPKAWMAGGDGWHARYVVLFASTMWLVMRSVSHALSCSAGARRRRCRGAGAGVPPAPPGRPVDAAPAGRAARRPVVLAGGGAQRVDALQASAGDSVCNVNMCTLGILHSCLPTQLHAAVASPAVQADGRHPRFHGAVQPSGALRAVPHRTAQGKAARGRGPLWQQLPGHRALAVWGVASLVAPGGRRSHRRS